MGRTHVCKQLSFLQNRGCIFFENICRGDARIKLNDGVYKVFFNAADYAKMENDEERNFFKFLAGHEIENDLTKFYPPLQRAPVKYAQKPESC